MSIATQAITFTVPAIPIAQPRPRATVVCGHAQITTAQRGHPVHTFKATCRLAAQGCVTAPFAKDVPLSVRLVFVFPRQAASIWKTKAMPRYPRTTKPDVDNLAKAVLDALNGLLWTDDGQVVVCVIEKWHAAGDESPRVEITVEPMDATKLF